MANHRWTRGLERRSSNLREWVSLRHHRLYFEEPSASEARSACPTLGNIWRREVLVPLKFILPSTTTRPTAGFVDRRVTNISGSGIWLPTAHASRLAVRPEWSRCSKRNARWFLREMTPAPRLDMSVRDASSRPFSNQRPSPCPLIRVGLARPPCAFANTRRGPGHTLRPA